MSYLYVNGGAEMYPTETAALAALQALIERLVREGYKAEAHSIDPHRFTLTHPANGSVDAYVHDDPPA
jgi:hypothetical protein